MQCRAGKRLGGPSLLSPGVWEKPSPNLCQPEPVLQTLILQSACICVLLKAFSLRCPQELFRTRRERLSLIAFYRQPQTADFIWEIAWDTE